MSERRVSKGRISHLVQWIRRRGAWGRIFSFLLLLAIALAPIVLPIYWLGTVTNQSNIAEIVALALIYIGFLIGLPIWGKRIHGWRRPFRHCGLSFQLQMARDLLLAMLIGMLGVFAMFGLQTIFGWAEPSAPSPRFNRFVVEGLIMALAVGFAEEMLFRGWLLSELEENYSSRAALWMCALFFAATHFIKPWSEIVRTFPQFLGLVVLGMALVWARRSPTGRPTASVTHSADIDRLREPRLGYPIGLHAGLIYGYYLVNVGGLSEYTNEVPKWVTGVNDNPLAGLLGLVLLSAIAYQFSKTAKPKTL